MTLLYWQTSNKRVTLQQSIQDCSKYLAGAIGLIYSPKKCYFIRLNNGNIEQPPIAEKIEITSIFEARIFNQQVELRWLNECNGEGKAVLISEQALNLDWNQSEILELIAIKHQQYILWGTAKINSEPTEWSQLFSNRIGSLYVPCNGIKNRVCLRTREYFKEDDFGNVAVVEERLMKLETVS